MSVLVGKTKKYSGLILESWLQTLQLKFSQYAFKIKNPHYMPLERVNRQSSFELHCVLHLQ